MEYWKKLVSYLFHKEWSIRPDDPAWLRYAALFDKKLNRKKQIRDIHFVLIDTETTGFDFRKDHILSIGAIGIRNYEMDISDRFEYYLKQEDYHPGKSIEVHGILPSRSQKGISEKEMLIQFLDFCQDRIIVGHHIGFDIAMLNTAMKKHFGKQLKNKVVDTGILAQRLEITHAIYPIDHSRFSLDALCQQYHIAPRNRHTASGDAFITGILFLKLLDRLEKRGISTLGHLLT
ncbi:MAG: DNA polymerase III subunit epsilon [Saprospiraceae bacterium]|nr:MAG: DNA polymerase III subunit epsilon [Saprospiraceae bacterium]